MSKIIPSPEHTFEAIFSRPYEVRAGIFSYNLEVTLMRILIGTEFTGYGIWSDNENYFATSQFVTGHERKLLCQPVLVDLTHISIVCKVLYAPKHQTASVLIPNVISEKTVTYRLDNQENDDLELPLSVFEIREEIKL